MAKVTPRTLLVVWGENFARVGTNLVILPLALAYLPDNQFSFWLLFQSLMAFASLADSGLSPTLLRATAYFMGGALELPRSTDAGASVRRQEEPNWQGIHTLVATAGRIYIWIVLAAGVLMATLGLAASWNLLSMTGYSANCYTAFAFLVAWSCTQVAVARWSGILQGMGHVVSAKKTDVACSALTLVASSVALVLGGGLLALTVAGFGGALVNYFAMRRAVRRRLPRPGVPPKADRALLPAIGPATWRLGAINWGAYLITQGSALVVAQLSDPRQIAAYLLTLRLFNFLRQFAQAPMVAYLPNVVASLAKHDMDRFRAWTSKIVTIALVIFVSGAAGLIAFGDSALHVISTEKELLPRGIMLLLSLAYVLETHHVIHASLYIATNRVPFLWPAVISGAATVGFGLLVVPIYGVRGIVTVQIIVQALCNNWFPVYLSLRLSGWRFFDYLISLIRTPHALLIQAARMMRQGGCVE
jgi:O-antigen/teichoic acid export membrane protein